jgi:hypothetical protein
VWSGWGHSWLAFLLVCGMDKGQASPHSVGKKPAELTTTFLQPVVVN